MCVFNFSCPAYTLEFSLQVLEKNTQMSNFMTICPVGAESFHAEGQTNGHDEADHRAIWQSAQELLSFLEFYW